MLDQALMCLATTIYMESAHQPREAQIQNILNAQQQDFLNAQNYPYKQLAFMSDTLRGIPMSQNAQSLYQAPASAASQLAGIGLGAYGLSRMAEGGRVGSGLADLAIANMA